MNEEPYQTPEWIRILKELQKKEKLKIPKAL